MKKILGSFATGALLFFSCAIVFAASAGGTFDTPSGGYCGIDGDCAKGLVCDSNSVCAGGSGGTQTPGNIQVTPAVNNTLTPGNIQVSGVGLNVSSGKLQNPIKYDNFYDFVEGVLKTAVDILMPFVVLAFIWSGFLFVKAQGAPAELEEAKSAIKWSIVGAFILMGAWGFAQIIGTTVSTLTQ